MNARDAVIVKFIGRQLSQIPLVTFVVVVIHPVINHRADIREAVTAGEIDLIFHVAEKTLLRRVVPAVPTARHGLAQMGVLHNLNEFQAGVMAPLVAVDQGFAIQRNAMIFHQLVDRFQNKIDLQGIADTKLKLKF